MARLPLFQQKQFEFTAHVRDPENVACPANIEDRRMGIYRDLLFNNITGFLESSFPVLRTYYDDKAWKKLARAFFVAHRSQSPYFVDISKEFILYLQSEHQPTDNDPPYLFELAHFEWAEVALMVDQDEPDWDSIDPNGNMLDLQPVLSPTAFCLAYQWPVHEINRNYHPVKKPENPSFILIYRDAEGDVKYTGTDPVTARIMELLQDETPRSGRKLLEQLAREMQHPDLEQAIHSGYRILLRLLNSGIIAGTKQSGKNHENPATA